MRAALNPGMMALSPGTMVLSPVRGDGTDDRS